MNCSYCYACDIVIIIYFQISSHWQLEINIGVQIKYETSSLWPWFIVSALKSRYLRRGLTLVKWHWARWPNLLRHERCTFLHFRTLDNKISHIIFIFVSSFRVMSGKNKRITPLPVFYGCRKRRLKNLQNSRLRWTAIKRRWTYHLSCLQYFS
jgi:hypothetical protein